jgi:hypothetical protein
MSPSSVVIELLEQRQFLSADVMVMLAGAGGGTIKWADQAEAQPLSPGRNWGSGEIESITLDGDTDARTRLIVRGRRGAQVTIGNLTTNGDMQMIVVRGDVRGDVTINGPVQRLVLGPVNAPAEQTITLADNRGLTSAVVLGSVHNATIDASAPILNLRVDEWTDGGGTLDEVSAPWMRNIVSRGDFEADVILSEDWKSISLSRLVVRGSLSASYVNAPAIVRTIVAGRIDGCEIAASQIVSCAVRGDMVFTEIHATDDVQAGVVRMSVAGWLDESLIEARGDLGLIRAGGMRGTDIYAGNSLSSGGGLAGLLSSSEVRNLDSSSRIRAIMVRGIGGNNSFVDSNIASNRIGAILIRGAATSGSEPFGVAADRIDRMWVSTASWTDCWKRLTASFQSESEGDLVLRIV